MVHAHPVPAVPPTSSFASEDVAKTRAKLREIGMAPKPDGWKDSQGWVMSNVHTLLIDMLARVYAFADWAVEHDDLANYLGFADMTFAQICHHHHFEETVFFPNVQQVTGKDVMAQNVIQHHTFAPQLEQTWSYVRHVRQNLNPLLPNVVKDVPAEVESVDMAGCPLDADKPFDPAALQSFMDGWMPPLALHLGDEINTLAPANLDGFGDKEAKAIDATVTAHLKAYDPHWFLCSALAMMPNKTSKLMINLPTPVRRLIVPFIFARKNHGVWPYCALPENLTFSGSA